MSEANAHSDSARSSEESWTSLGSDGKSSLPTTPGALTRRVDDEGPPAHWNDATQPGTKGGLSDAFSDHLALGTIRVQDGSQSQSREPEKWVCVGGPHAGTAFPASAVELLTGRGWIQTQVIENRQHFRNYSVRILVDAQQTGQSIHNNSVLECRKHLKRILAYVDKSTSGWNANWALDAEFESYLTLAEQDSLFYLFNTLPSPSPSTEKVVDVYSRQAMEDIFGNSIAGLQTTLYAYQQRSAAMMIQREAAPRWSRDPRKSCFQGPTGIRFYYDQEEGILVSEPCLFEEPRGGILAETMGYGKTLICLAVVLATKGHYSRVPADLVEIPRPPRQQMATLAEMACAKVIDGSVPWRGVFDELAARGYHYDRFVKILQASCKEYTEPLWTLRKLRRGGERRVEKTIRLCSSTLIIVPPNLFVQWQQEIEKHVGQGALRLLALDNSRKTIPGRNDLALYDVVLITKGRFDQEFHRQSPLTDIRWLRVILDEGTGFGSTAGRTNTMAMLDKMYFDRRWVVSGTPSPSLRGVEVGLAANETVSAEATAEQCLQQTLAKRRQSDVMQRENQDLDKLRSMVTSFLKVQPWANAPGSDHGNWTRYLAPYDRQGKRRDGTGLRPLLESIMVRHTIGDIEADLSLPMLHNKVVYLEPSYYDKVSINLFNMVLASNAVLSERTGQDYMFHPSNRRQIDIILNNLCHSSFHWVGFRKDDVEATLQWSKEYMARTADTMSASDQILLAAAIEAGERAIHDVEWLAFSRLHEIGVFVDSFPDHACESWALGRVSNPLLMGTVQARAARQYIEKHVDETDPSSGLPGAGLRALLAARRQAAKEDQTTAQKSGTGSRITSGPQINTGVKRKRSTSSTDSSPNKRSRSNGNSQRGTTLLPKDSPLRRATITGFSSSKLTYLVGQIMHHLERDGTTKFLIFYPNNNVAFWLAEALELVRLEFRIYANTLSQKLRSQYLSLFNSSRSSSANLDSETDPTPNISILLMDIRQASHGLHVAAANRIYIINPIWQADVEAQAIKRAHRIGQQREVWVETLVLRGTMEERMLERRKQMTWGEAKRAEKRLLDDSVMGLMVRDVQFLPIGKAERGDETRLPVPQRLFGREGDDREGGEGEGEGEARASAGACDGFQQFKEVRIATSTPGDDRIMAEVN